MEFPLLDLPVDIIDLHFFDALDVVQCIMVYGTCRCLRGLMPNWMRRVQLTRAKVMCGTLSTETAEEDEAMIHATINRFFETHTFPAMAMINYESFLLTLYGKDFSRGVVEQFDHDGRRRMLLKIPVQPSGLTVLDLLFSRLHLRNKPIPEALELLDWAERSGIFSYCRDVANQREQQRLLLRLISSDGAEIVMANRRSFTLLVFLGDVALITARYPPSAIVWRSVRNITVGSAIASGSISMFYQILNHWTDRDRVMNDGILYLLTSGCHSAKMLEVVANQFVARIGQINGLGVITGMFKPRWLQFNAALWDTMTDCVLNKANWPLQAPPRHVALLGSFLSVLRDGWRTEAVDWFKARGYLNQSSAIEDVKPWLVEYVNSTAYVKNVTRDSTTHRFLSYDAAPTETCPCHAHSLARYLTTPCGFTDMILPSHPTPNQLQPDAMELDDA